MEGKSKDGDLDFLGKGNYKSFIQAVAGVGATKAEEEAKYWQKQVREVGTEFLSIAVKSSGFASAVEFIKSPKEFYAALPIIATYEGFLQVLDSIFNTKDITVDYNAPGKVSITVNTASSKMLVQYTDKDQKEYRPAEGFTYWGFKLHSDSNAQRFFARLFQFYMPAGMTIDKFTLKHKL